MYILILDYYYLCIYLVRSASVEYGTYRYVVVRHHNYPAD
jgi:hypothetical protein